MKKIIMGLFVVAAMSATVSYGIGKKSVKKGIKQHLETTNPAPTGKLGSGQK